MLNSNTTAAQTTPAETLKARFDDAVRLRTECATRVQELRNLDAEVTAEIADLTEKREAIFLRKNVAANGAKHADSATLTNQISDKNARLITIRDNLAERETRFSVLNHEAETARRVWLLAECATHCAEAENQLISCDSECLQGVEKIVQMLESADEQTRHFRGEFKSLFTEITGDRSNRYNCTQTARSAAQALVSELEGAGVNLTAALRGRDEGGEFLPVASRGDTLRSMLLYGLQILLHNINEADKEAQQKRAA